LPGVTWLLIAAVGVAFIAALAVAILASRLRRSSAAADAARSAAADAIEKKLNILELVGDGLYIVDDELVITHVNEEAERLLHSAAGSLVGRRLDRIIDPLASELVPEIREARRTAVGIQRTHSSPALGTWIELRIHAAANETLVSLRDVSERTGAERRLRDSEQRLQLVTQNVDAVLWTADREGRFTTLSGGALDELGLVAAELLGKSCDTLVDAAVLRDVFAGKPARLERPRAERWLRHHIEPLADARRSIVGAVGVTIDVTELKRAEHVLFDAAHRDRLTGLPNRLSLEGRLAETIAEAERERRGFAVLFMDLDRFKTINDTLGHNPGDEVLREVAARLQTVVREGDVVARPGGDEFIILLPRAGDTTEIQTISQRLLRTLADPIVAGARELYVTASIGAAVFPAHGRDAESLIAHADAAMYRAKGMGGNRYSMFEPSMETVTVDRLSLEHDLRGAVDRNELELRYQPIVEIGTNDVVGCEALVRWRHPVRGLIAPDTFIGIAEETGTIVGIDRWVLREACAAAARIRAVVPEFRMSVNVSSRDLREPDLPEVVARALADNGLPPRALTVEVTESVALDDSVLPVLTRLHALGVGVAMDDFGVGYSSLSYLKRLPITALKVDRSFVRDVAIDKYDEAIIASIVAIAHGLGFRVVAEGIEDESQLRRIASLGCDHAQGFYFGRPQTLGAFELYLRGSLAGRTGSYAIEPKSLALKAG
jgi:diguanylate cyclase (GGDEF)-like protein/PAS domain S-box-containing protein